MTKQGPGSLAINFANRWHEKIAATRAALGESDSLKTDIKFFTEMEDWCRKQPKVPGFEVAVFDALSKYYKRGSAAIEKVVLVGDELEAAGGADFVLLLENPKKATLENHAVLIDKMKKANDKLVALERLAPACISNGFARCEN